MTKILDEGQVLSQKYHCIANETEGKDGCASSDGLALYEHNTEDGIWYDSYCWSCRQLFNREQTHNSSVGKELGLNNLSFDKIIPIPKAAKSIPMTKQEVKNLILSIGYKSNNYRGIRDEISQFFGHLTKLDSKGNVVARFYPETEKDIVTGYKCRTHPKDFSKGKVGKTGITSDLSGQVKFKNGGKYVLITGGEEDKAAAYQMLLDDQLAKGNGEYNPIAVVSPTVGEGGAAKQCAYNYDFLNKFDNIIIGLDNDEAGKRATEELAKVLPAEKVKIATWSMKDPNDMLLNKKEKQFVRDFYSAKSYVDDGIITSVEANNEVEGELLRPKIPLPDFMQKLEDLFAGGIPLGYWVNWIAMTGIGKTTTVNEAIRKWIYDSPYKVGILSLELTAPQYMIAMLSREVGYKINLIKNPKDAIDFVSQEHVIAAREKLCINEQGEERFVLLDERDGNLDQVKRQIERLIKKHNCKLIVVDPLNDLFDGCSHDEQAAFCKWMKSTVKKGITFCCVCHVKKSMNSTTNKDGKRILRELTEDDISGLGLIPKSGGANIFLSRDKYAEDEIERNTTNVTIGKCRWTGNTGNGGKWFYQNTTHTMHDYDTFFNIKEAEEEPYLVIEGVDEEDF